MSQIAVVGGGVAGVGAAVAAARTRDGAGVHEDDLPVLLFTLSRVLEPAGVLHVPATVCDIDAPSGSLIAQARDGEEFDSHFDQLVIATGSRRQLTASVCAPRDALGHLVVDAFLRAEGVAGVFAVGDTAQHADAMGRVAGHNAVAALLGLEPVAFRPDADDACPVLGEPGRQAVPAPDAWARQTSVAAACTTPTA